MSGTTSAVRDGADLKDAVAGAVVAVVGGLLLLDALSFTSPGAQAEGVGPRFFPLVASSILVVGGLSLIVNSFRHRGADETASGPSGESPIPPGRLAVVIAQFVGFLLIFEPIGFLLATALFMTLMTSYVRPDKWRVNTIVAVATSVTVYFSFTELLGVGLPPGILG
ncbi:tripartite tricarboxylate transporter TctB family protein [Nocardioides sp. YIM B13467]|uniref:tripartite tricarboxylate transporter TctB family protein n=1 Tax=Nocardioides sp. YIM B13467 TaxID=3366294 RepID=UPI00366CDE24